jgi:hypothetical protein
MDAVLFTVKTMGINDKVQKRLRLYLIAATGSFYRNLAGSEMFQWNNRWRGAGLSLKARSCGMASNDVVRTNYEHAE